LTTNRHGLDALNYGKPLLFACSIGNKEIVELLIKHGALVDKTFENGKNALTVAFEKRHRHLFDILMTNGANFNCKHGFNFLMENCKKKELGDLEFLLKNGAPTIGYEPNGMTPLMIASANGFTEKVRLLLNRYNRNEEKSGYVNRVNKEGLTALHLACMKNHQDVAKLLIEHGAAVNQSLFT